MGFLSGSLACTRFNIVSIPESIPFNDAAFKLIQPGSTVIESAGFLPFEIEEDYEIGAGKYAFRVRIDKVNIDSTMLKERLRELIKIERDQGKRVGPKVRRKLKDLAEQELLGQSNPRSKVIEGVIENSILYVGSTSKSFLGKVLELLLSVKVEVEFKTPWLDKELEEEPSDVVDLKEPGQSIYGCRFLKALIDDSECFPEPEKGNIKLATIGNVMVTLTGEVMPEYDHYMAEGAEVLSAKLLLNDLAFSLDGLAYRLSGMKLEAVPGDHWHEVLDGRMNMLKDVWDILDVKFNSLILGLTPERTESPESETIASI